VNLVGAGAVIIYGDVNAGVLNVSGGKFVQNYVDTIYNTGGEPEYLWTT
jgi:hypothetical protein